MNKKNPKNVVFYDPARLMQQDEPDGASFISLILCSAGMFMRNKIIIWISIFFIISTFCRRKNGTSIAHYLINLMMIIFGIVTTYMMQPPALPQTSWFVCFIIKTCGLSRLPVRSGTLRRVCFRTRGVLVKGYWTKFLNLKRRLFQLLSWTSSLI